MAELTYSVDKTCGVCEKEFQVTKVRSRIVKLNQDTDFCTYYQDINPYYYTVWVCPHCGYAAQESHFPQISSASKDKIAKFLSGKEVRINLCGPRTRIQAITAYKLAIYFAEMEGLSQSEMAGLYLRLGWLYREGQQTEEEQQALAKAAEHFEQALYKERFPISGMSETAITYIIGELLRRTGKYEQSLLYFSKVVASPQAKLEKKILDMARDAWREAREAKNQGQNVNNNIFEAIPAE